MKTLKILFISAVICLFVNQEVFANTQTEKSAEGTTGKESLQSANAAKSKVVALNEGEGVQKAQNGTSDFLKRFKVSGFGYIAYFRNDLDLSGQSLQYRLKLDSSYDIYDGYLAHLGIFFTQGSATPDSKTVIYGSVFGSRGGVLDLVNSDRFGISVFGASKTYKMNSVDLGVSVGRFNLDTPFSSDKMDMYAGIKTTLQYKNTKYYFLYSFSYMPDHIFYALTKAGVYSFSGAQMTGQSLANIGIGNALFVGGIDNKSKYLDTKFYLATSPEFFDVMAFYQSAFKKDINDNLNYGVKLQLAYAKMSDSPGLKLGSGSGRVVTTALDLNQLAKNRGIYNLNAYLQYKSLMAKVGFLGSFGDGYGVILNSTGALDVTGIMWQNNFTSTYEGFGILGSGGIKNSSIFIAYSRLRFEEGKIATGLDIAYIGGNNHYPISSTDLNSRNFIELTPHFRYNLTKQLDISLWSSFYFLDFVAIKTKLQIQYKF